MRTTVDIPDSKYRKLRMRAAHEGRTIKALIDEGVDLVLQKEDEPKPIRKLKLPLIPRKKNSTHVITSKMVADALADFP